MFISQAWAQSAGGAGGAAGLEQLLPFVLIFVVFYFLLIRPQQQKAKKHKLLVANLRRGDRVVTNGGMFGTVAKVINENEVQVEVAEGVRVRMLRSAVTDVLAKTEPAAAGKEKAAAKSESGSENGGEDAGNDGGETSAQPTSPPASGLGATITRLFGGR